MAADGALSGAATAAAATAAAAAAIGAAIYAYGRQRRTSREGPPLPEPTEAWHRFDELAQHGVSRKDDRDLGLALAGTVVLCTQNLAVSGANQVLLNLVEGAFWSGPVILLSPSIGPFAKEFADLGVAVFIGSLEALLARVSDIRLAVCNTIMTAHLIVTLESLSLPTIWVLHEWWPAGVLEEELAKRNDQSTTPEVVAQALAACRCTISVCAAQRALYGPAHGVVTFVGVPEPQPEWRIGADPPDRRPLTVLCLGILCPRKNQHWAVEVFREFAADRQDVRLLVVGARYVRQYEIDYVEKVKAAAGGDPRVEIHDVTNDVDQFYRQSDLLLFTSLNEVTPMVIAESMMRSLPVVTTNIAGIPEMLTHRTHGLVLPPERLAFVAALRELCAPGLAGQRLRLQMGAAAKKHADATFTTATMVSHYRRHALSLSAPVVLLDMDGVVVDWDAGFLATWGDASHVDRRKSYAMEECVPPTHRQRAIDRFHRRRFFATLPPRPGAVAAVRRMVSVGLRVYFCTSPVLTSDWCASEKYEWVVRHFGRGAASRVVMTSDKTAVRGDVLIDDKPKITGAHTPTWQHIIFDAPYNKAATGRTRLMSWEGWEDAVVSALKREDLPVPPPVLAAEVAPTAVTSAMVAHLPDFSHLLPPEYRSQYLAWRTGKSHGAKGEAFEAAAQLEAQQDAALNRDAEDFTELTVFRRGYSNWRRGGVSGAREPRRARNVSFLTEGA